MTKFRFETKEEKQSLKDRALSLRPKVANVVATERGWEVPQPNGQMETLVSFQGLDSILGDVEPNELVGEPIDLVLTSEESSEDAPEVEVVVAKKKPGRPAKVAE